MGYQSINPATGDVGQSFAELSDTQLEVAIHTAATCFESWRQASFAERAAITSKAAAIMREHSDDFARPVTLEMGKLFAQAQGEVALSADIIDYYAQNAERFLATERLAPDTGTAEVVSTPIGVPGCCSACSRGISPIISWRVLRRRTSWRAMS